MKLFKLLIGLLLITTASVSAQSSEYKSQGELLDNWTTLEENYFSIQHPESWEVNVSGLMGTSFLLFSPVASAKDQFRENVNLLVQDLTGQNIDLVMYVEISEGQISTMVTDGNLIESKRVGTDTFDYQKVIYTGRQGIFNLKFEQYYWIISEKAYILTLTCEETQFEAYQDIGEKILNSFQLKID